MPEVDLRRLVTRLSTLPTVSPLYGQISAAIENPRTSAADVGALVARDATTTARLLRMVNSAFFGYPERVTTVTRAVTIVGFDALRNLILATSVLELFNLRGVTWKGFSPEELWQHSLATAIAARAIARRLARREVEEFFVAGLIHDIGKMALLHLMRERYLLAVDLAARERLLIVEAERTIIGLNHTQVGRLLTEAWNLPRALVTTVARHHQPPREPEGLLPAAVHLADIMARALAIGSGGDERVPPLADGAWETLGLALGDLAGIMGEVEQEQPRLAALMHGLRADQGQGEAA
jgi:putative nucleotidyltransferase with HDIG domain